VCQSHRPLNQSFADLFIQYVDRESKPKPNFQFDISTAAGHKKTDGSPGKLASAQPQLTAVLSNSPGSVMIFPLVFFSVILLANRNIIE
jgi:hypothetical protein